LKQSTTVCTAGGLTGLGLEFELHGSMSLSFCILSANSAYRNAQSIDLYKENEITSCVHSAIFQSG
jgi:hypothetical protein